MLGKKSIDRERSSKRPKVRITKGVTAYRKHKHPRKSIGTNPEKRFG